MPSTTDREDQSRELFGDRYGAGGEPLGEPGVPGMTYEIGGGSPDLGP
jgi:hypothetical protein